VSGLTQVRQTRFPSLAETNTFPSSQKSTHRLFEEHFWSNAHCVLLVHSTQTQLLLVHTPFSPHWALETQSRQRCASRLDDLRSGRSPAPPGHSTIIQRSP
jgi:hypothetical protein